MKAIISYGRYFHYGKQYQIKFVYENELEAEVITANFENLGKNLSIIPYYTNYAKKRNSVPINAIEKSNIPKSMLLTTISNLINIYGAKIIIRNQEFTVFKPTEIQMAIEKLHVNGTLSKGKFNGQNDTYFITFTYATDEQREEILYDFTYRFKTTLGEAYELYMLPIYIANNGKISARNSNIVAGTNIPEKLLPYFMKKFIEENNMIINIGTEQLKDKFDNEQFQRALLTLEKQEVEELESKVQNGRSKTRTKTRQGVK